MSPREVTKAEGPLVSRDGTHWWYRGRHLHREDGPAVERPDGGREWWQYGELHRESGPAIMRADGSREWWRRGRQCRLRQKTRAG
jgi:hypothetical protein